MAAAACVAEAAEVTKAICEEGDEAACKAAHSAAKDSQDDDDDSVVSVVSKSV